MDFRSLIRDRLKATHERPADLLGRLDGKVGKQSLYDYLGGRSGSINSSALEAIFDALGLEVLAKVEVERLRDREALVREAITAIEKQVARMPVVTMPGLAEPSNRPARPYDLVINFPRR